MGQAKGEIDLQEVGEIIQAAKKLALRYRDLTGKPLGITGEVAEYEAARLLGLQLCPARTIGYDAIRERNGVQQQIQIKGRYLPELKKPGQRVGTMPKDKPWESALLVLLNADFEPEVIYEAQRDVVEAAIAEPGSKARNERRQLSVSKFKSIAARVWP